MGRPRNRLLVNCDNCGAQIEIVPSCLRMKHHFCNPKCYHDSKEGRAGHFSKNKLRMFGKDNPQWKGDSVGYLSLHEWIKSKKPQPEHCESCKQKIKRLDLANISGEYKRDVNDFEWLCRKCHMTKDGRINRRDNTGKWSKNIKSANAPIAEM